MQYLCKEKGPNGNILRRYAEVFYKDYFEKEMYKFLGYGWFRWPNWEKRHKVFFELFSFFLAEYSQDPRLVCWSFGPFTKKEQKYLIRDAFLEEERVRFHSRHAEYMAMKNKSKPIDEKLGRIVENELRMEGRGLKAVFREDRLAEMLSYRGSLLCGKHCQEILRMGGDEETCISVLSIVASKFKREFEDCLERTRDEWGDYSWMMDFNS